MNKITRNIFTALLLIIAQSIIFNNINLLGYLNPFVYIVFIIYYPIKNDRIFFIFISFLIGILIDIFSDTLGLHAAASVTIAYLRPLILKMSFGLAYIHQVIKFKNIDFKKKLIYISLLSLIHHSVLFSLEIFSLSKVLFILEKAFMSSIFTIIICFLFSYLFKTNER
ncbi:rod shape-determining protein MreD [Flavobacteriaceae bacterium]|jgi:rod shape-determining protein MreD|nr:rod shape-determining protein MreD [Flavobacteriaceae bacterium]